MINSFMITVLDRRAPAIMVSNDGTKHFKVLTMVRGKWVHVDSFKSFDCMTVEESHNEAMRFFDRYLEHDALQLSYNRIIGGFK